MKISKVSLGVQPLNKMMHKGVAVYPDIVKDGLVYWLDAKGKTNTETNKAAWEDISGNGHHFSLVDFDYTSESGWQGALLKCDGVNDYFSRTFPVPVELSQGATFSVAFNCHTSTGETYVYMPSGNSGLNLGCKVGGKVILFYGAGKNSLFAATTAQIDINKTYYLDFVQEADYTKKIYINGVLMWTEAADTYTPSRYIVTSLSYNRSLVRPNADYYYCSVYNRGLSAEEIAHNYSINRSRFSITANVQYPIRSLMPNADFSTAWAAYDANTISTAASNIARATIADGKTSVRIGIRNALSISMIIGHKYYGRCFIRVPSIITGGITFKVANVTGNVVGGGTPSVANEFYKVSGVFERTTNTTTLFWIYCEGSIPAGWYFEVKDVMILDLTVLCGVGNEPDVAWCDANIPFNKLEV